MANTLLSTKELREMLMADYLKAAARSVADGFSNPDREISALESDAMTRHPYKAWSMAVGASCTALAVNENGAAVVYGVK